ncbi:DNA/RNA polymerase [Daedaleopsis nitida]|nr:DNA/RNA polymerase [Daedaleopsis nitida]
MPTAVPAEMRGFLQQPAAYTILPTPLPDDAASGSQDLYFADSSTKNMVALMDACLHRLHDVPRAKHFFEQLRELKQNDHVLEPRVYNLFLEAYLEMATNREEMNRANWLEDAWMLYNDMESGHEKVAPTPNTYAIMLLAWLRFNPDSNSPVILGGTKVHDPISLLRSIINRQISPSLVVADRAFTTSEEAVEAIKALSKAAVEMGLTSVVSELGVVETLGKPFEDPLADVPEVVPVMKPRVHAVMKEDGGVSAIMADESLASQGDVPFNLETLRRHLSEVVFARRVLAEDVALRQKMLEQSVYNVAVERMKHQAEMMDNLGLPSKGLQSNDLRSWMWQWHQKLQARIEAEIRNVIVDERVLERKRISPTAKARVSENLLSPFLQLLKPEKLSLITIMEVMHLHSSGGVNDGMKVARALLSVGRAVEAEYKAEMCKKNNISIPTTIPARSGDSSVFGGDGYRDLYARRVTARKYMEDAEEWTSDWSQLIRVKVGSFLVDCLMDTATVVRTMKDPNTGEELSEEQPAFFHTYEYLRGQRLGVIKFNPAVAERMAKDPVAENLHPRHLPMLVKPLPWLSYNHGGYMYSRSWAMRFKDSREQEVYLRHASEAGRLELVFAGLDVLGSTPWQVNRRVFDVVLQVWNSGERFGKIPPAVPQEPEPVRPDNYEVDNKAKTVYIERQKAWQQAKAANHSDRCSVNYKVEIARAFLGDTIYFPHNVDFRGRAYPIPPHLSHIGDDLSRGLLLFGESKPLAARGLRWLKIHLANLYGYDKASFDERVKFVEEHLDEIRDSAERPLEGNRWWTKADDPWQCLATCIELKSALELPDPEAYECALPVHQDGTCNGLQHYAALGGDAEGAAQVNLAAADRPSDVYTYVAQMVEKSIADDLEEDHPMAQILAGKIARKVVKQTVMTTVYGVTYVGARDQIERQLKDRGDIAPEMCWMASSYLAKKVLASIGDLFKGAKEIQSWLNMVARLIAKAIPNDRLVESMSEQPPRSGKKAASKTPRWKKEQMTSVVWTTPLGLPIVQPYRAIKRKQVMTAIQTVFISDPNLPSTVNSQKQATAFPPNFIHSLDATHMMLTALECRAQGMTFASVHDSYWTHPSDIDQMSAVIRDTFIALHSSNVLKCLLDEFKERYANYKVPLVGLRGPAFKQLNINTDALGLSSQDVKLLTEEGDAEESEQSETAVSGDDEELALALEAELGDEAQPAAGAEKPKKRRLTKKRSTSAEEIEAHLAGTFVNLVDILPDLPEKGKFDVQLIKQSQYFFS